MTIYDPQDYQIHITTFVHSNTGKKMFCGRVSEIKNIYVEESTIKKAYEQTLAEIKIFQDHYKKQKLDFPEPFSKQSFSGDLRVRLGKELHKKIAIEAAKEGMSLNKYIISKLRSA